MAIEFVITERLLEFSAEYLFEHGTSRGVRWMLKLMKRRTLVIMQKYVEVRVGDDLSFLDGQSPNRYVTFPISVRNPTPWELKITDASCSILYNDIIYSYKAIVLEKLPVTIPKGTHNKVFYIRYDPFSSPLGLPPNQVGWKVKGLLAISSYFGNFEIAIPDTAELGHKLVQNENEWNDAVNYVKSKIKGV
jgi:hypothetical protein